MCVWSIERAYRGSLGRAYAPADLEEKEVEVYGTVGHMKVKPGKMKDVQDNMLGPQGASAKGFRGLYFLVADEGNEAVMAVIFEDKDSYTAMVHDPKTHENFGNSWRCSRESRRGPTANGTARALPRPLRVS